MTTPTATTPSAATSSDQSSFLPAPRLGERVMLLLSERLEQELRGDGSAPDGRYARAAEAVADLRAQGFTTQLVIWVENPRYFALNPMGVSMTPVLHPDDEDCANIISERLTGDFGQKLAVGLEHIEIAPFIERFTVAYDSVQECMIDLDNPGDEG